MQTIVTLTLNPSIDRSVEVDSVVPERKLRCGAPRYDPGGGGLNVARAVQRLGGQALAITTAGGLSGARLRQLLEEERLPFRAVPVTGDTRENLHVYEMSTRQQYRFNMPGAPLSDEEMEACLQTLGTLTPAPDWLVLSGSLPTCAPPDLWARAAHIGRERGARVIVDTSGPALPLAAREGVHLLKPNLAELGQMAGCEVEDDTEIAGAAHRLIEAGHCAAVAVSLAAAGVVLVTADGAEHLRAPTVRAVSKVGAGDSMVAGTVLGLSRGMPVREAVRFGIAAGTAAVMRPGTQLCRCEDAERLYAAMG